MLYLKAILTVGGESAVKQYKYILKNFPKSIYAPEAAMKIGNIFMLGVYIHNAPHY